MRKALERGVLREERARSILGNELVVPKDDTIPRHLEGREPVRGQAPGLYSSSDAHAAFKPCDSLLMVLQFERQPFVEIDHNRAHAINCIIDAVKALVHQSNEPLLKLLNVGLRGHRFVVFHRLTG